MTEVFICDAIRTPIGRYGGALSAVRPDDLAAHVLKTLLTRNPNIDPARIDDVVLGCANQSGEDSRNVARMAALLAGLPAEVAGVTVNRLCGSGLDAVAISARSVKAGEASLILAGGVESMTRAPLVIAKAETAFSRNCEIYDSTIGWRFVNAAMKRLYGVDSMPETAETLATEFGISRADQDAFALRSQQRAARAIASGRLATEIVPVPIPQKRGEPKMVTTDEHPRPDITAESLAALKGVVRPDGSVTAGNASGVNDGACALVVASGPAAIQFGLTPRARVLGTAVAGVPPRIMGIGPVPAIRKLLTRTKCHLGEIDVIELNEAFASQALAVLLHLGLPAEAEQVNPNGGAIALGHPLGMSGARLVTTAVEELQRRQLHRALCTMCVGVGQGIAMLLERV